MIKFVYNKKIKTHTHNPNIIDNLPIHLKAKLVPISSEEIIVNKSNAHDIDVLNYIAWIQILTKNSSKITYTSFNEIYKKQDDNDRIELIDNASVIQKKVAAIIQEAVQASATDIHIILQYPSTQIKFRIIGELSNYQEISYSDGNLLCSTLYNTMTQSAGTSFNPRAAQDGNMRPEFISDSLAGVRIASSPTQDRNYFMVLRLLPKQHQVSIENLGYIEQQLQLINQFIATHYGGITIFAGPTGSGKSTSLQAIAKAILDIHQEKINFLTIEDPVEYPINTINKDSGIIYRARQIAINSVEDQPTKKKLYNDAVVAAMRQDPDIIMIGEMRDEATTRAALNLANTGHPVFSTLHARSANSIIARLVTIGADINLLLTDKIITGMIAQQLIPTLCPNCKISLKNNLQLICPSMLKRLNRLFKNNLSGIFLKGNGCYHNNKSLCFNGYQGRSVIAEVINPDSKYLELIRANQAIAANEYWLSQGGITMMMAGIIKLKLGLISPVSLEEALEPIIPPNPYIEQLLHSYQIS